MKADLILDPSVDAADAIRRAESHLQNLHLADRGDSAEAHACQLFVTKVDHWVKGGNNGDAPTPFVIRRTAPSAPAVEASAAPAPVRPAIVKQPKFAPEPVVVSIAGKTYTIHVSDHRVRDMAAQLMVDLLRVEILSAGSRPDSPLFQVCSYDLPRLHNDARLAGLLVDGIEPIVEKYVGQPFIPRPEAAVGDIRVGH